MPKNNFLLFLDSCGQPCFHLSVGIFCLFTLFVYLVSRVMLNTLKLKKSDLFFFFIYYYSAGIVWSSMSFYSATFFSEFKENVRRK